MTRFGAGVQRGAMAGDNFTQIANALFRNPRISFKAKGLFGLISTHRDGWRVTIAMLARSGTEGTTAVSTGLEELERFGYLTRERTRRDDGTLAEAVYAITDMPAHLYDLAGETTPPIPPIRHKNRRSSPGSGNPSQDHPPQGGSAPKNTKRKKTTKQNTRSVRPSVPNACASTREETPDPGHRDEPPPLSQLPPGVAVLLSIGARHSAYLLTGPTLADQGATVTQMLDAGWSPSQIEQVIAGRPLPDDIHTSVGAIVSARIRAASALPPPAAWTASAPTPGQPDTDLASRQPRTVSQALTYRALTECAGCGRPGKADGQDLCPACLDWPLCRTCPGPTRRRAHPAGDGRCATCASA
ncbi:hypothetical protein ACFV99_26330 [Streptomyces sp. NPDC059944]|uniref:hypothetical protein n=1 Tax=unclassified Streptomyces TaxID=2593676 RepID=UPI00365FC035